MTLYNIIDHVSVPQALTISTSLKSPSRLSELYLLFVMETQSEPSCFTGNLESVEYIPAFLRLMIECTKALSSCNSDTPLSLSWGGTDWVCLEGVHRIQWTENLTVHPVKKRIVSVLKDDVRHCYRLDQHSLCIIVARNHCQTEVISWGSSDISWGVISWGFDLSLFETLESLFWRSAGKQSSSVIAWPLTDPL